MQNSHRNSHCLSWSHDQELHELSILVSTWWTAVLRKLYNPEMYIYRPTKTTPHTKIQVMFSHKNTQRLTSLLTDLQATTHFIKHITYDQYLMLGLSTTLTFCYA